jgi:arabinofuranan 3-O-arabinosyltransferase
MTAEAPPAARGRLGLAVRWVRRHPWQWTWPLAVAVVTIGLRAGSLELDARPELYLRPWSTLLASLSTWQESPTLGQASTRVGLAPIAALSSLLHLAGIPPWLVARVIRWALLCAAGAGAGVLARAILGETAGRLAPRLAGAAYLLNPYVVVAGASLPVIWPYALLPWQLWTAVRGMRTRLWWPWALAFAVTTFAMAGQNAGAVPALQLVATPVVVLWAAWRHRAPWRRVAKFVATAGASSLLLSAYWLLPTTATRGADVATSGVENVLEAATATSSYAEVLRGMGLWSTYGQDDRALWNASQAPYLTSAWLVLATFLVPVLVAVALRWGRPRARFLGLTLLVVTAVLMVGAHPWASPSPLGWLWRSLLDAVPVLRTLGTTNMAGAALVLGVALALAAAAAGLGSGQAGEAPAPEGAGAGERSATGGPVRRSGMLTPGRFAAVGVVVLALAAEPGWTGAMFSGDVNIPGYWRQAAADLDREGTGAVWFLPGQTSSNYRWSTPRHDDIGPSLFHRPTIVRTAAADTSREGANLLAAVDRYLGVTSIVVRNDVAWETAGGADPETVVDQVLRSRGLGAARSYGTPTEQTEGLAPLLTFRVRADVLGPRIVEAGDDIVVAGDGDAFQMLSSRGFLASGRPFRYAEGLSADAMARILTGGAQVVLTDTNRRRESVPQRLGEDHGPVLPADHEPVSTESLGAASDQSVRIETDWKTSVERVTAMRRELPQGSPRNAIDGDPGTVWWAGDFGTALEARLDISLPTPHTIDKIDIRTARRGVRGITSLVVSGGGRAVTVRPDRSGVAHASLSGIATGDLSVRIAGLAEGENGNVGIADVDVDGVPAPGIDAVRTPASRGLLEVGRIYPQGPAPLDVLLERQRGRPGITYDDEEANLSRDVVLPWRNTFTIVGQARLSTPLPERALDDLEGDSSGIQVTSSSQAFDLPRLRASEALDGNASTAWSPREPAVGQSWHVKGIRESVGSVTITQPTSGRQIKSVKVSVNGGAATAVTLEPGTTSVPVNTAVTSLDITVAAAGPSTLGRVSLVDVGVGGATISRGGSPACTAVATLDGRPSMFELAEPLLGSVVSLRPCQNQRTRLSVGVHRWRPVRGFVVNDLWWQDTGTTVPEQPPAAQGLDAEEAAVGPGWSGRIPAATQDMVVLSGRGYDPRWKLSVNGRSAGEPELINGWEASWLVTPQRAGPADLGFGPQRLVWIGLTVSLLTLAGIAVVLWWAWRNRPRAVMGERAARRLRLAEQHEYEGKRRTRRAGVPRRLAAWKSGWRASLLVVVASGLVLGWAGALASVVLLVLRRLAGGRAVWGFGVAAIALAPVVWAVEVRHLLGRVTPALVTEAPAAHYVAGAGLLALVVWAVDDILGQSRPPAGDARARPRVAATRF